MPKTITLVPREAFAAPSLLRLIQIDRAHTLGTDELRRALVPVRMRLGSAQQHPVVGMVTSSQLFDLHAVILVQRTVRGTLARLRFGSRRATATIEDGRDLWATQLLQRYARGAIVRFALFTGQYTTVSRARTFISSLHVLPLSEGASTSMGSRALPAGQPLGEVGMIAPDVDSDWMGDIVHPDLRCISNETLAKGLRRALGLRTGSVRYELPEEGYRIVAMLTGRTARADTICRLQRRYAIRMPCGYTLLSHPLFNAWSLANEPAHGTHANCVVKFIDLQVRKEATDSREEVDGNLRDEDVRRSSRIMPRAAGYYEEHATVSCAFLIQVAPTAADGRLTLDYGDAYGEFRDYERGLPPARVPPVPPSAALAFLRQHGPAHLNRALVLNGAPLDGAAISMRRAVYLYPGVKRRRLQRLQDLLGVTSVPMEMEYAPGAITASLQAVIDSPVMNALHATWVVVVVSDGTDVLLMTNGQGEAELVMQRTTRDFPAYYAAQGCFQSLLGPVWEVDEAFSKQGFTLLGMMVDKVSTVVYSFETVYPLRSPPFTSALEKAFARRFPSATLQKRHPGYVIVGAEAASLRNASMKKADHIQLIEDALAVRAQGGKALAHCSALQAAEDFSRVCPCDFVASDIARDEEQYGVAHQPCAESKVMIDDDFLGMVMPFNARPIDPTDTRVVAKQTREAIQAQERDGEQEEPEDRDAWYEEGAPYRPHLKDPSALLKALRPDGEGLLAMIREGQGSDEYCQRVMALLAGEVTPASSKGTANNKARVEEREAAMVASHLLEDGVLMHLDLEAAGLPIKEYVVPRSVVRFALEGAHDCMQHVGVSRTISALKTARLWWPSLQHDVREHVLRQCRTCAMNKAGPHVGEMHVPNNGFMPWHTVAVDIVHLEETASGYCAAVVFCCRMIRAVEAAPCSKNIGAEEFINIVTHCLISKGRKPVVLYSDRGSNIIAKLCKAYYSALGINNIPATSHLHTLVAVCERFNGTLRTLARAAYFDTCYQWDALLPIIVLTYMSCKHPAHGYSPFYLDHGREAVLPWHDVTGALDGMDVDTYAYEHLQGVHFAYDAALRALKSKETHAKARHDKRYQTNVVFHPPMRVLVLQPGRISKMEMPYIGPFRIVSGPDKFDNYLLRDLDGRVHPAFHVSKLKRWPDTAEDLDDLSDEYYVVERIISSKMANGVKQYLVKWLGYNRKYNLWISREEANEHARELMDEYDATINHGPLLKEAAETSKEASGSSAEPRAAEGAGSSEMPNSNKQRDERDARLEARNALKAPGKPPSQPAPPIENDGVEPVDERAARRAARAAMKEAAAVSAICQSSEEGAEDGVRSGSADVHLHIIGYDGCSHTLRVAPDITVEEAFDAALLAAGVPTHGHVAEDSRMECSGRELPINGTLLRNHGVTSYSTLRLLPRVRAGSLGNAGAGSSGISMEAAAVVIQSHARRIDFGDSVPAAEPVQGPATRGNPPVPLVALGLDVSPACEAHDGPFDLYSLWSSSDDEDEGEAPQPTEVLQPARQGSSGCDLMYTSSDDDEEQGSYAIGPSNFGMAGPSSEVPLSAGPSAGDDQAEAAIARPDARSRRRKRHAVCGTPGCNLPDYHEGPHSFELEASRTRQRSKQVAQEASLPNLGDQAARDRATLVPREVWEASDSRASTSAGDLEAEDAGQFHATIQQMVETNAEGRKLNWQIAYSQTISQTITQLMFRQGEGGDWQQHIEARLSRIFLSDSEGNGIMGLHACRRFQANEVIGIYEGRVIDPKEYQSRVASGSAQHVVALRDNAFLDASSSPLLMQLINDPRRTTQSSNCRMSPAPGDFFVVRATRRIEDGTELLMDQCVTLQQEQRQREAIVHVGGGSLSYSSELLTTRASRVLEWLQHQVKGRSRPLWPHRPVLNHNVDMLDAWCARNSLQWGPLLFCTTSQQVAAGYMTKVKGNRMHRVVSRRPVRIIDGMQEYDRLCSLVPALQTVLLKDERCPSGWRRASRNTADQHVFRQLAAALPAYDGVELHSMGRWHSGEDEIIMFRQAELTLTCYHKRRIGGFALSSPLEQGDGPAVSVWPLQGLTPLTEKDPAFFHNANDEHGAASFEEVEERRDLGSSSSM